MSKKILLLISLILLVSCGAESEKKVDQPIVQAEEIQEPSAKEEAAPAEEKTAKKAEEKPVKPVEEKPAKKEEKPAEKKETPLAPAPQTPAEPTAVQTQAPAEEKEEKTLCTISVTCKKLIDEIDEENENVIPKSGYILNITQVEFTEGESVFDLIKRCLEKEGISIEYREDPIYKSVYIESIGGISEKDFGAYSGWMYKVNGTPPTVASSEYKIKEGDVIEFYYSC